VFLNTDDAVLVSELPMTIVIT